MSWMTRLYETYENNQSQIGIRSEDGKSILLPVAHLESPAHVEITLDRDGNILAAKLLSADEPKIIIPCSEDSAGRTSNLKNHPLIDKLQYIAKDYKTFGGSKKSGFELYEKDLENWASSDYSNEKIEGVYKYITKGTVIKDLIDRSILTLDKNGILDKKWDKDIFPNSPKIEQENSIVRWRVEVPLGNEPKLWENSNIRDLWIKYNQKTMESYGYCYISNSEDILAQNHPKNIYVSSGTANAKLISSNEDNQIIYTGRFENANQAYGVSYKVSQKAHNALKWLITKQGYSTDNKVVLTWGMKELSVPSGQESSLEFLGTEYIDNIDPEEYAGEQMAQALKNKIRGYKSKISRDDKIIIMNMESGTKGRLSIIYYQELTGHSYIDKLERWHTSCVWEFAYKNKKYLGAPAPIDIAKAIYGDSDSIDVKSKLRIVDRILACIIDEYKIPMDIVYSAINKTIKRISYDNDLYDANKKSEFDKMLGISCALFNKYSKDYKKGEYDVALEKDRKTRDYLYGRLLAVAQKIENYALYEAKEVRMTNADRLMHRFSEHPFSTWKTIEVSLKPYIERLGKKSDFYLKTIDEIMYLFESEDFIIDRKLSGEFLLGYHCQRQELFKSKIIDYNQQIENN